MPWNNATLHTWCRPSAKRGAPDNFRSAKSADVTGELVCGFHIPTERCFVFPPGITIIGEGGISCFLIKHLPRLRNICKVGNNVSETRFSKQTLFFIVTCVWIEHIHIKIKHILAHPAHRTYMSVLILNTNIKVSVKV